MFVQQFYTNCLAHAAYYIESQGEAAIVDPLRDVSPYIELANERGAKIKYVFETHFHADFVSGHIDLAEQTGATIIYGPTAQPNFNATIATDDEEFSLGRVIVRLLHTPGHTMESSCYLLLDEHRRPYALFSGDTLFLGDVGRPDLAQKAAGMTREELAGLLYDSIKEKILDLPDSIIIYPGHGAGSACGKKMSDDKQDTLAHQKEVNYALRNGITRDEFIHEVTTGLQKPPQYFPLNATLNKGGYESINEVLHKGTQAYNPATFKDAIKHQHALIIDTRKATDFAGGFIKGALNIGIDGDFAPWVGTLVTDIKQPILLIADADRVQECVTRLSRVGYDNCIGYLQGGMQAWQDASFPVETIERIAAEELAKVDNPALLDVRRVSEYSAGHLLNAKHVPLDYINDNNDLPPKNQRYYVYCAAGYRSMIFISLMKNKGYNNLVNIDGGFKALVQAKEFQITESELESAI